MIYEYVRQENKMGLQKVLEEKCFWMDAVSLGLC